jgi:4-hydroxybenzoate polyprenyltransferase
MWKLLVVGIIIYLFRHELRRLGPHWRSLLAAGAGLVLGLFYAGLLQRFGILDQIARALGIGPRGAMLVVLIVFAIGGLKVFEPFLRNVFREGGNGRRDDKRS